MQKVRLFFEKNGRGVYISHLDMVRSMARGLSRAGIKVKYTEGFNPIAYLVFGQPLSLGYAGLNEVCDFSILGDIKVEDVAPMLSKFMPDVIKPTYSAEPVHKLGNVGKARYEIELKDAAGLDMGEVRDILARDSIVVLKKSKRGETLTDIVPLMQDIEVTDGGIINCTLACSSTMSLNPNYIIKALNENGKSPLYEWESITRKELLLEDSTKFC